MRLIGSVIDVSASTCEVCVCVSVSEVDDCQSRGSSRPTPLSHPLTRRVEQMNRFVSLTLSGIHYTS